MKSPILLDTAGRAHYLIPKPTGRFVNDMPRTKNKEHSARRRNEILNAAIKAFARKGLSGTSMDDIVRESGLSKGAIYWYFKSKDEIIMELMTTFFSSGMPELKQLVNSSGSASAKLRDFLELAVAETNKMMQFRPVVQELYVLALRDKTVKKLAKKEFEGYHKMLESIITRGIDQGEFKKVEPHQVANSILSLMEGTILIWSLGIRNIEIGTQIRNGVNSLIAAMIV